MAKLMEEKFSSREPEVTIMRIEAHEPAKGGLRALFRKPENPPRVLSFTLVDRYDPKTGMTSMMRTTAWPAAIVVQMLAAGKIAQRGAIRQETDVPAEQFLAAMERRGIKIEYSEGR